MQLDMNPKTEKAMVALEEKSIEALSEALGRGGEMDDTEKAAVKLLGVVAKNRQTLTARSALNFQMAREITSDPAAMRKYVAATNPQLTAQLNE